jgi:acetyl-CoA C-acetyltransferase
LLPPVFRKDGTVHAGSSSGIVDGAAAMIVLSGAAAKRLNVQPAARLVEVACAGVDPAIMGIGPVPAVRALMERTGLAVGDFDLIELNEAFAAQVLACQRELKFDLERVNVLGGAIAIGHPIGATGARITVTLVHEMLRRRARRGLSTLCISGGLGIALLLENARL